MSNIPSPQDLWVPLETAPIPERPQVSNSSIKAKLTQEQQKKVDAAFWEALEARNLDDVKKALEDGARLEMRKQGGPALSALYVSFEKNFPEIALFLMEQGANINALGTRKQSLSSLAASHDSAELMEGLITHGLDITKTVRYYHTNKYLPELFYNAPRLIKWWIDKDLPLFFKDSSPSRSDPLPSWISTWTSHALKFHKDLFHPIMDKLNKEAPSDWKSKGWVNEVNNHWLQAFYNDNAELIRFMVKQKWLPNSTVTIQRWVSVKANAMHNIPTSNTHALLVQHANQQQAISEEINIFWKAASARAVRCMELLLSSSAMREWVEQDLNEKKEFLIDFLPTHMPTLEKLLPLGLDLTMSDNRGTIFHHHNYDMTKGLAEWLLKKSPEALMMKNKEGKTIFDAYHRGNISLEWAEKSLLQRNIEKAPRKSKTTPVKVKARL